MFGREAREARERAEARAEAATARAQAAERRAERAEAKAADLSARYEHPVHISRVVPGGGTEMNRRRH